MSIPLNYTVQITDDRGRPTPEFLRLWQGQSDINGTIPIPSGNATQFLNGLNPGQFAQVKDSDLAVSDITTNNASLTAHGFLPKLTGTTTNFLRADGTWAAPGGGLPTPPSDATQFLNGAATPAYAKVKDSDLSVSNVTTNNATTSQHGFLPALGGGTTNFLRADGTWAAPPGGGAAVYLNTSPHLHAPATVTTDSFAMRGAHFTCTGTMNVYQIYATVNHQSGRQFSAWMAQISNNGTAPTITSFTQIGTNYTDPDPAVSSNNTLLFTTTTPYVCTAGNVYAVLVAQTNLGATNACRVMSGTPNGRQPINGVWERNSEAALTAPTVSATLTGLASFNYAIWIGWSV